MLSVVRLGTISMVEINHRHRCNTVSDKTVSFPPPCAACSMIARDFSSCNFSVTAFVAVVYECSIQCHSSKLFFHAIYLDFDVWLVVDDRFRVSTAPATAAAPAATSVVNVDFEQFQFFEQYKRRLAAFPGNRKLLSLWSRVFSSFLCCFGLGRRKASCCADARFDRSCTRLSTRRL